MILLPRVFRIFSIFAGFLLLGSCEAQNQKYYKGKLHSNSYWSDRDEFPEIIKEWYKNEGFDFVALSDHKIIAADENWKTLPKDSTYQKGFLEYLKKCGKDWVECHYHFFGSTFSNAGHPWLMVQADKLYPHSLIKSMESGKFYATTGVDLEKVTFKNNSLSIKIKTEVAVRYKIQFIAAHSSKSRYEVLKTIPRTTAEFVLPMGYLFVRAKILSGKPKKNPCKEGDFEVAWAQAFLPEPPSKI